MRVCQLNILAPIWINEEYKVLPCYELYTSPQRLNVTLNYLKNINADIYCLCEVEEIQMDVIDKAFKSHHSFYTSNAEGFWSEFLGNARTRSACNRGDSAFLGNSEDTDKRRDKDTDTRSASHVTAPEGASTGKQLAVSQERNKKWISNGTCVLLSTRMFDYGRHEYIDFGDGCRCTLVTATHKITDLNMLIISVDFDAEVKFMEAFKLMNELEKLREERNYDMILISGDYNFADISSFEREGYVEMVGTPKDTTPLPQGMIDHTLLLSGHQDIKYTGNVLQIHHEELPRNAGQRSPHSLSKNAGLRQRSPQDIISDLCQTVGTNGSDHYATVIDIEIEI